MAQQRTTTLTARKRVAMTAAILLSLLVLVLPNTAALSAIASTAVDAILPGDPVDKNAYSYSSVDVSYVLSRGADGRSHLATTETLVADFPDTDQNTGMIRRIPNFYQGHGTHVRVSTVTDASGQAVEFSVNPLGDYTAIRITDGSFLHGETTYVISYEQDDVTAHYDDDELFWDVNGVNWLQPIDSLRATVTLDPSLAAATNGNIACITGEAGESYSDCDITANGDSTVVTVAASSFQARENLTMSIGFVPRTFSSAPLDIGARFASAWYWLGGLSTLGPVISVFGILLLARIWIWNERRMSRPPGTVIAQYVPPKGISVAQAAYLLDTRTAKKRAFAADTVDQVVRGNLALDRTAGRYIVRIVNRGASKVADRLTVHSAYRAVLSQDPGSKTLGGVVVEKDNYALRLAFGDLRSRILASVGKSFTTVPRWNAARYVFAAAAFAGAAIALSVYGPRTGGNASANLVLVWGIITVAAPILTWITLYRVHLPTANTLQVVRHLEGLRVYIQLAEQDRMRILQGPDSAEFVVSGASEIVALNEKLLGYAVLFGLEKEWAGQIGVASTTASPAAVSDLVSSASIGAFVGAVSSTTPHSPSSSSSSGDSSGGGGYSGSSGGSDGGGSSGDGGGGGGSEGI